MFIKKDVRNVVQMLTDEKDPRTTVILTKRFAELQGSTKILCKEINMSALMNLRVLNLYDNGITNLHGIGLLAQTPIEEINLGSNKLSAIPSEFGQLSTLHTLWLEDNSFEDFPTAICRLYSLKNLRLSGNSISTIPPLITSLENLENLALDNNELTEIPEGVLKLQKLKKLWLRQNQLVSIPDAIDELRELEVLSVSSNQIEELPYTLASMPRLKSLYANGNKISNISSALLSSSSLQEINLANNLIEFACDGLDTDHFSFDEATSLLTKRDIDTKMVINLSVNPVVQVFTIQHLATV